MKAGKLSDVQKWIESLNLPQSWGCFASINVFKKNLIEEIKYECDDNYYYDFSSLYLNVYANGEMTASLELANSRGGLRYQDVDFYDSGIYVDKLVDELLTNKEIIKALK